MAADDDVHVHRGDGRTEAGDGGDHEDTGTVRTAVLHDAAVLGIPAGDEVPLVLGDHSDSQEPDPHRSVHDRLRIYTDDDHVGSRFRPPDRSRDHLRRHVLHVQVCAQERVPGRAPDGLRVRHPPCPIV